jgi:hypothetical protein
MRVAPTESVGAGKPLESERRPQPLLEVAVVSLETVVQVSGAPMLDARKDRPYCRWVTSRPVGDDRCTP